MKLSLSVLALPAVLATTVPASATETRINSLGGGVKLWTIEDESNVFDFPSLLVRWGNRVYVDNIVAAGTDQIPGGHFGFHYNLSDETVLAFYGGHLKSTDVPTDGDAGYIGTGNIITGGPLAVQGRGPFLGVSNLPNTLPPGSAAPTVTATEYRWGLAFATQVAATVRFGLSFNFAGEDVDQDSPTDSQSDGGNLLFDIGLGLGVDLAGSELELAAGVQLGILESAQDNLSGTGADLEDGYSGSHFGLRLGARWTFDFFDQTKIVSYAQFLLGSQDIEQVNPASVPAPFSAHDNIAFTLGADLRIEPFQGVIVSPGLGFYVAQQTLENNSTVARDANLLVGLPFYGVAVDLELATWVALRFGAQQFVDSFRESETDAAGSTDTFTRTDVTTTFSWGLGFNIPVAESELAIDLAMNPSFFNNGPHILSGTATGQFALNAALRYNW